MYSLLGKIGDHRRRNTNRSQIERARHFVATSPQTVVLVTSLLRAREIKVAHALKSQGWHSILVYITTTPFEPEEHFDVAIRVAGAGEALAVVRQVQPRICHVFSGAIDEILQTFCRNKPAPLVIDLNDVFCDALFNYCHERFEPTRECLSLADAFVARDLQAQFAARIDGFDLPPNILIFPEYCEAEVESTADLRARRDSDEVHVVSVGTFSLEKQGWYDSGYLTLARRLVDQGVHFHIFPHWFYQKSKSSVFGWSAENDLSDFYDLQKTTPYLHLHQSLSIEDLRRELPKYDFGIIAGGSEGLGQRLEHLKKSYMDSCYSGRIADYLEARQPILINPEVSFNFYILKRYGVVVDLNGVLSPGFRETLLSIKRDPSWNARLDAAARSWSLAANAPRLTNFYERVIRRTEFARAEFGKVWQVAAGMPGLKRAIATKQAQAEALADQVNALRHRLAREAVRHAKDLVRIRQDHAQIIAEQKEKISALSFEVNKYNRLFDDYSGLLNWPEIRVSSERNHGFSELVDMLQISSSDIETASNRSVAWSVLNKKNLDQLLSEGYRNFKRSLATNYFTFMIQANDPQLLFLEAHIPEDQKETCRQAAAGLAPDPGLPCADQATYRYFVMLLWLFAARRDRAGLLNRLAEPMEGNPILVPVGNQVTTQDLVNSVLEYYSIAEGIDFARCRRVLEIGAGYGRNAYVMLREHPEIRYVIVDIPPALYVAQRYLSSQFADRNIFYARPFDSYDSVKEELDRASIAFLAPHQISGLPDLWADLTLNISSFGEMSRQQIERYLQEVNRLTERAFYHKQWKVSQNPFDGIEITEGDYSMPEAWRKIYHRDCNVQTGFFEAMYLM